jgi:ribose transport system permease protein
MVLFVLLIMVALGLLLTQTTIGRYTYAVGFDPEVSRLAGVRVKSIQALSLIVAGLLGSFTGLVLTAKVASSAPAIGDSYLLPAFAAVFLGATQFKSKRFNAAGTVLSVYMLGTGQYGLVLAGAPPWAPNVFQGAALIAAIGFTQVGGGGLARIRRRKRAHDGPEDTPAAAADPAPVEQVRAPS